MEGRVRPETVSVFLRALPPSIHCPMLISSKWSKSPESKCLQLSQPRDLPESWKRKQRTRRGRVSTSARSWHLKRTLPTSTLTFRTGRLVSLLSTLGRPSLMLEVMFPAPSIYPIGPSTLKRRLGSPRTRSSSPTVQECSVTLQQRPPPSLVLWALGSRRCLMAWRAGSRKDTPSIREAGR